MAIGMGALGSNTTGNGNIAVGSPAGHALTTGNQNIVIGNPTLVLLPNPTPYASVGASRHAPLSLAFMGWQPEITTL
jgi:hypothetical protein